MTEQFEVMSRENVRRQFTECFRGAEFSAWDDLESPVIRISPDRKMGWMIVRVPIAYTKKEAASAMSKEDTVMAWVSAYEKREGKWLPVANATTSKTLGKLRRGLALVPGVKRERLPLWRYLSFDKAFSSLLRLSRALHHPGLAGRARPPDLHRTSRGAP